MSIEVEDIKIGDYVYAHRPKGEHYKNTQLRLIRVVSILKRPSGFYEVVGKTATPTGRFLYAHTLFWTFTKAPEIAGIEFEIKLNQVKRRK